MDPEEFIKFNCQTWGAGWGQETRVWTRSGEESLGLSAPCSFRPRALSYRARNEILFFAGSLEGICLR